MKELIFSLLSLVLVFNLFACGSGDVNGKLPIDTGKHVYKHWTPIMQKKGAAHPLMDPDHTVAELDSLCHLLLDAYRKAVSHAS